MTVAPVYTGPQCPHCSFPLAPKDVTTGTLICSHCNHHFEATIFTPPERKRAVAIAQTIGGGLEEAAACANHARNAATATCQRCGLFICALCDMNVGTGSYCPSCFERVRTEGTLQAAAKRYRDYAAMARTAVILGAFFSFFVVFGAPFGAAGVYYSIRARKQRREEGRSAAGVIVVMIVAILEVLGGVLALAFLFWSLFNSPK